jgi:hypothetical protein
MTFNLLMVAGGVLAAVAAGLAARLRQSRSKRITTDQVSGDWLAQARGREDHQW